jgi:hypothetical protein
MVPVGTGTGTTAWSVYEAAILAASLWWQEHESGYRLAARELAAKALGSSKAWTPQRQQAFANLVGTPFDLAVDQADSDVRLRGPFRWRVGNVIADAAACRPWVSLPSKGVHLLGVVECDARGILVIENEENFEKVCGLAEVVHQWLCVWGRGYVNDGVVSLLRSIDNIPIAAWADLDAHGVGIVTDLRRRVDRSVTPVGMDVDLWSEAPERRLNHEQRQQQRRTAGRLVSRVPLSLRDLAVAIAATGRACEQESLYRQVLPSLSATLGAIAKGLQADGCR